MVFQVVARNAQILRRGAAVLLVVGAASGCSSGAMRFTDGAPTASTSPQRAAPTQQAYPGDSALAPANVDGTYTGSINRTAVQPATQQKQRFWQRAFRAPVPGADVGGGKGGKALMPQQAAAQPYPVASQPAQPFPAQPFPAQASGTVVRAPMADPVVQPLPQANAALPPASVDRTATGSIAPAAPAQTVPGGTQVTARAGDTLKSLSHRYGVSADRIAKANGLPNNATLSAGQTVVIPAFGAPAEPQKQAAAPDKAKAPAKVPLPSQAPSDRVAVLPQQARQTEKQAAPSAAPSAGSVYTVQSGDTINGIARKLGVTAASLKQANNMQSGVIRVGQRLVVPGAGAPVAPNKVAAVPAHVDPITTGSVKKEGEVSGYTPPKKQGAVEEAARQEAAAPATTGVGRMRWPVTGKVISDFGSTRGPKKNDGIDIAVPEGTAVKAAENGVVIYAGDGLKDFGNTVLVRHDNGLVTVYGHASELKVSRGETVRRGQEIARSGVSGNTDATKLHFEVRKDSTPVDPAGFLE